MGDPRPPYLQLCVAPIRKRRRRTAAGGRAACTRPQTVRTCGGTGPAGPTAATGGLSGPIAPTGPGPCCPPPQCGGRGWREEQREAPGASLSHLGPPGSLFTRLNSFSSFYGFFFFNSAFCFYFFLFNSVSLLLICPSFALYSCFSSWIILLLLAFFPLDYFLYLLCVCFKSCCPLSFSLFSWYFSSPFFLYSSVSDLFLSLLTIRPCVDFFLGQSLNLLVHFFTLFQNNLSKSLKSKNKFRLFLADKLIFLLPSLVLFFFFVFLERVKFPKMLVYNITDHYRVTEKLLVFCFIPPFFPGFKKQNDKTRHFSSVTLSLFSSLYLLVFVASEWMQQTPASSFSRLVLFFIFSRHFFFSSPLFFLMSEGDNKSNSLQRRRFRLFLIVVFCW